MLHRNTGERMSNNSINHLFHALVQHTGASHSQYFTSSRSIMGTAECEAYAALCEVFVQMREWALRWAQTARAMLEAARREQFVLLVLMSHHHRLGGQHLIYLCIKTYFFLFTYRTCTKQNTLAGTHGACLYKHRILARFYHMTSFPKLAHL